MFYLLPVDRQSESFALGATTKKAPKVYAIVITVLIFQKTCPISLRNHPGSIDCAFEVRLLYLSPSVQDGYPAYLNMGVLSTTLGQQSANRKTIA